MSGIPAHGFSRLKGPGFASNIPARSQAGAPAGAANLGFPVKAKNDAKPPNPSNDVAEEAKSGLQKSHSTQPVNRHSNHGTGPYDRATPHSNQIPYGTKKGTLSMQKNPKKRPAGIPKPRAKVPDSGSHATKKNIEANQKSECKRLIIPKPIKKGSTMILNTKCDEIRKPPDMRRKPVDPPKVTSRISNNKKLRRPKSCLLSDSMDSEKLSSQKFGFKKSISKSLQNISQQGDRDTRSTTPPNSLQSTNSSRLQSSHLENTTAKNSSHNKLVNPENTLYANQELEGKTSKELQRGSLKFGFQKTNISYQPVSQLPTSTSQKIDSELNVKSGVNICKFPEKGNHTRILFDDEPPNKNSFNENTKKLNELHSNNQDIPNISSKSSEDGSNSKSLEIDARASKCILNKPEFPSNDSSHFIQGSDSFEDIRIPTDALNDLSCNVNENTFVVIDAKDLNDKITNDICEQHVANISNEKNCSSGDIIDETISPPSVTLRNYVLPPTYLLNKDGSPNSIIDEIIPPNSNNLNVDITTGDNRAFKDIKYEISRNQNEYVHEENPIIYGESKFSDVNSVDINVLSIADEISHSVASLDISGAELMDEFQSGISKHSTNINIMSASDNFLATAVPDKDNTVEITQTSNFCDSLCNLKVNEVKRLFSSPTDSNVKSALQELKSNEMREPTTPNRKMENFRSDERQRSHTLPRKRVGKKLARSRTYSSNEIISKFRIPKELNCIETLEGDIMMDNTTFLHFTSELKSVKTSLLKLKRILMEAPCPSPLMKSPLKRTSSQDVAMAPPLSPRSCHFSPMAVVNPLVLSEGNAVASTRIQDYEMQSAELRERLKDVIKQNEELEKEADCKRYTICLLQKQLESFEGKEEDILEQNMILQEENRRLRKKLSTDIIIRKDAS